jgi:hypothetical protein
MPGCSERRGCLCRWSSSGTFRVRYGLERMAVETSSGKLMQISNWGSALPTTVPLPLPTIWMLCNRLFLRQRMLTFHSHLMAEPPR